MTSLELILMIIKNMSWLICVTGQTYTHVVAKIEWSSGFNVGCIFGLLALVTLSIFVRFSKIRCQNLS